MKVDYSLYLVTDSTNAILGDRDLFAVVDAAVEGGVTIVQYRDKTSETRDLIRYARVLHSITKRYRIPLLINDRVDVALAVGCEGVHIGQDDMDLASARKLLGKDAIIGVSVSSPDQAGRAIEGVADYLGIGTVFATPTKENTKSIIGTAGVRDILSSLAPYDQDIPTVCIGGINATNVQRVLYQAKTASKGLDGVAVVSAIMAAEDPERAASELRQLIAQPPAFARHTDPAPKCQAADLLEAVPYLVKELAEVKPICHNMTNLVVQNFAANVALCIGASPIMSNNGTEATDLAALNGALVINMGTVTQESLTNYQAALRAYNTAGNPVLFDPVGGGATATRRGAIKTLMAAGYFDLIKGNEAEISTVLGEATAVQQRGVDSSASGLSPSEKSKLVKRLAARERNVVLMTGVTDYLSDGNRTYAISNGHEYLGSVTGTGCTVGTTIAAYMAVHREDKLLAALAGILHYEIAAERAGRRDEVRGPGTFVPAFLDELYRVRMETARGDYEWVKASRVEKMDV